MSTETTVQNLKINKLTKAQYDTITPSATEAYELTDLSNILDSKLQNTATGTNALTIGGTASGYTGGTNIGASSQAKQNYGTALGFNTNANGNSSTCIGRNAGTSAASAIQIGAGINSTANTLQVGFIHASTNYQLLDGTTGKIPSDRLNIATSVSTSSTNAETVGAKLFYDTVGNIETLLQGV